MFVPCSILISKMLSDTVERAPYAMIFTGLSVVLLFVYNDMNLNLVILMLGLALIILAKNIQNTMRRNLNSHDYNLYKNAGIAIICIIFVGLFAGPAVMDTGTNYNTQERLGQTAQVEIPSNELIVRGPKVPRAWPFLFYAQRPMEVRGVQYINQDTNLNYALIMKETQSQISREYTTIDTVGNYKLIQFQ